MNTSITTRLLCAIFAVMTSAFLLDTLSSTAHSQKAAAIAAAASVPLVAQLSGR